MLRVILRAGIVLFALAVFACNANFASIAHAQVSQSNAATISGSVSDGSGKPVAGATVSLKGPRSTSLQTDAHGLFVFLGVPLGAYTITVTSLSGTVQREISVENDTNVAIAYEPNAALKTIANVSANARFNVTPASVTHVDPMQLAMQGQTSWRKVLEQIPGVVQAGLGNGTGSYSTMPDSPLATVLVSINGALPYETATLLDDMPLVGSGTNGFAGGGGGAGTDLSLYPMNGFSSADVVRGPGAGAPSIVDSIGGSLVLHMPGAVSSNHYAFSLTTDPYGGIIADSQVSVRWKKLSVVTSYGFYDSPGPLTGQTLGGNVSPATLDGQTFIGITPACPSSVTCFLGTLLVAPGFSTSPFSPIYGSLTPLLTCCKDTSTPWNRHSGSFAVTYEVSPSLTIQAGYTGQHQSGLVNNQGNVYLFAPPNGYGGSLGAGQYVLSATPFAAVTASSATNLTEEKITAHLGRGLLKIAALQNRAYASMNSPAQPSVQEQLWGAGCLPSLPGGTGGCTSGFALTVFNGEKHMLAFNPIANAFNTGSNNRDELMSYETPIGSMYAGASFVQSYYNNVLDSVSIPTSPTSIESVPSAISQTTREARLFLGGNLSEKTMLDFSMYFVRASYHVPNPSDPNSNNYFLHPTIFTYADTGYSYAAPRIGFVWRPKARVAVRLAAGGGFAQAPLTALSGGSGVAPTFLSGLNVYSTRAANFNLAPEKSASFDLGTDIRLPHDTTFAFDVFQANLTGQIYSYVFTDGTYNDGIHGTFPLRRTQDINLAASRYQSVSVSLRHDAPQGFVWTMAGGLTRGYIVSVPPGFYSTSTNPNVTCNFATTVGCSNLNVVPGVNFNGTYTVGAGGTSGGTSVPYAQAHGNFGYIWNTGRSVGLSITYYGNNNSYFRPPFFTLDGNVHYPLTKHISLAMDARNITGAYDGGLQQYGLQNFMGEATVAGPPVALFGQEVGPRTVEFTLSASL